MINTMGKLEYFRGKNVQDNLQKFMSEKFELIRVECDLIAHLDMSLSGP